VLQQQEGIVVLVFNAGCIVEDSNVRVIHLIVTDKHQSGNINALVTIGLGSSGRLADTLEGIVDLANKLVVVDVAGANDN